MSDGVNITNVLLIEGDDANAGSILRMLRTAPAHLLRDDALDVVRAERLATAREYLDQDTLNMVLLTLDLPDSTGLDTLDAVCTQVPELPIVVLTGPDDDHLGLKAVRKGALDYLPKAALTAHLLARVVRYAAGQNRVEKALHETEERYRTALKNSPVIFAHVDRDLRYEWIFNPHPDFDPSTVLGYRDDELDAGPGISALVDLKQHVVDHGEPEHREISFNRSDGQRTYDITATPLRNEAGAVTGLITAALDVTEHKRAEEVLRESEARFRTVVEAMPVALVTVNQDGKITLINSRVEEWFGYDHDDLIGQSIETLVPERMRDQHLTDRRRYLHEPAARQMGKGRDLYARRKDGSEFPVEIGLTPITMEGDVHILSAIVDITERKRIEEARRRLAAIVESSDDAIIGKTLDGIITSWNTGAEQLYGYTEDEALGQHISLIAPPDRPEDIPRIMEALRRGERVQSYETVRMRKDGTRVLVSLTVSPIQDDDGTVVGASAIARNITRQKQAEAAIKENEERLRFALEAAQMGTWELNVQTNAVTWTEQTEKLFGVPPGQFDETLDTVRSRIHPDDRAQVRDELNRVLEEGGSYTMKFRALHPDGAPRWMSGRGRLRYDEHGEPERVSGIVMDITERVEAEQEVLQLNEELEQRVRERTAQLEATNNELEAFSYSVSHDLRAPLRSIDGFSRILLKSYADEVPPKARHYLQRIRRNTAMMAELVDDLLQFSRLSRQAMDRKPVEPEHVVREALKDLATWREDRNVEIEIDDLPACEADPQLLKQVYANLLTNALKYTQPREVARIRVGAQQNETGPVYFVADNGVGFDMAYADKLFGVFQRLHRAEDFEGTGVGLAIVQRVVHRHGGEVWAQAEPDAGATFYFTLPPSAPHGD